MNRDQFFHIRFIKLEKIVFEKQFRFLHTYCWLHDWFIMAGRSFLNEVYLIVFSYVILGSFVGTELVLALDPWHRSAVAGAWSTIFFIYLTYTFLPLHVRESSICGSLLGLAQLACALGLNMEDPNLWRQVPYSIQSLPICNNIFNHFTFL